MSAPTPRTDAAVRLTFAAGHNTVCPNFARKLERELAAQRKANQDLAKVISQQDRELAKERARFSEVRELVSGMRQALDKHGPNCRFEGVGQISESFVEELESAIDAAIKEDAK